MRYKEGKVKHFNTRNNKFIFLHKYWYRVNIVVKNNLKTIPFGFLNTLLFNIFVLIEGTRQLKNLENWIKSLNIDLLKFGNYPRNFYYS